LSSFNDILQKLKKGNSIKIVIILGLAGMLLILFSEIFSNDGNDAKKNTDIKTTAGDENYENYANDMEIQLKEILEKIDGVGNAEVMITVSGTEEYIYAQEEKNQKSEKDSSEEKQYVIIGSNGDKQALLKKIVSPEISGVVIICEGGDSNIVKERVYNTISAVFNIPSQRIYVTKSGN
jgi:stage III sporulation protein AG